ncbi:hypothetical protein GW931_02105 [archaeon]|nr:hypothetical protein [archaeon]PJC45600.1 MAG: hypothetical protein CO037_00620 [Candidatus Pacearchaeota archaeon CG_4_9_14_0_2_um_filter_30_8]
MIKDFSSKKFYEETNEELEGLRREEGFWDVFWRTSIDYTFTKILTGAFLLLFFPPKKEMILDYAFYQKNVIQPKIEKVINYFDYNKNGKIDFGKEFSELEKTIISGRGLFPSGRSIEAYELEAYNILKRQGKVK